MHRRPVYKSSARILFLHDSLECERLFPSVAVSRHDDGIRLLQILLPRSLGEALSHIRETKEEEKKEA